MRAKRIASFRQLARVMDRVFFPRRKRHFFFALLPSVKFALALKNEQVLFCSLAANFLWASKEKEGKELQGKTALF
jgi:hypothetical protein